MWVFVCMGFVTCDCVYVWIFVYVFLMCGCVYVYERMSVCTGFVMSI